ncbi:MAG: endonuclease III domain-containing protein [Promethearchaeota archaeon]
MFTEKQIRYIIGRMKGVVQGWSMLGEMARDPESKDPYRVLISTVLSVRNRDERTKEVTSRLFEKLPTTREQRLAPREQVEDLIRSSGFYRNKAKFVQEIAAIIEDEYDGRVPDTFDELVQLPGVGRKVANCVLVYAFDKPAIPVDTHVHRISNRIGLVATNTPEKTEAALVEIVPRDLWSEVNENFVKFGQQVCKPIKPRCGECPVESLCEKRIQKTTPRRKRKHA